MKIMKKRYAYIWIWLSILMGLSSCSITKHLPEGETLYLGLKDITIQNEDETDAGQTALDEVKGAISIAPNNAIVTYPNIRFPIPFGLWVYNRFERYEKGFGRWIFRKLAADPVYVSTVNPDTRAKVASNLLRDYGFFDGRVTYRVDSTKNPRAVKLSYDIDMGRPYYIDTLLYEGFAPLTDSLIHAHLDEKLVRSGEHFNVNTLNEERQRVISLLRDNGYYYARNDFITFLADTLMRPGYVTLKLVPELNLPKEALKRYRLGNTSVYLTGYNGEQPTDSLRLRDFTVHYAGEKPGLRFGVLRKRFIYRKGEMYSQTRQNYTQEALSRLGVFKFNEIQYQPRPNSDTLDVRVNAMFDLPYDTELELNVTTKSTKQTGPGAIFKLSKRNFRRMGASLNLELKGSYEWQTSSTVDGDKSVMNSYELGAALSLDFPRIVLPWVRDRIDPFRFPSETHFRIYAEQVNRARYFKMLSFGGSVSYSFRKSRSMKHTVTPIHLAFNHLQRRTATFDSIALANPMLFHSLDDQFIPSVSYTFTYDNSWRKRRMRLWWENSFTSAGNITSAIYAAFGRSFKENGNKTIAPYSEQFYVGGANSIRAFTVRSIGPGRFHPANNSAYSYVDETGDIKLEANLEYRFRLLSNMFGGNLNGAVFLDAGNVWLMREDEARPGAKFTFKRFFDNIALGTGVGIRYDLSFLILRLDWGIALHVPYETGRSGYYNIPRFKDGQGLHFAIGYPF